MDTVVIENEHGRAWYVQFRWAQGCSSGTFRSTVSLGAASGLTILIKFEIR